ncbi:MAG: IS21 family transposase [Verrucomicrobiae bacterium]|nr:IS21 family transposase [Verrucomicrobiae bacterium]
MNLLVREHNKGASIMTSAAKAGMSRNSARKYLKSPEPHPPAPRRWRTRPDPFAAIWPEVRAMLEDAPELEAKSLYEYLRGAHGQEWSGGLRCFQKRVHAWRLEHGPEKEVFFAQVHRPGEWIQADWMRLATLGITIEGAPVGGSLCHCVLPYSNWQWATRGGEGESLLSLQSALGAALWRLGAVPGGLQIDHSSAATRRLRGQGAGRGFTEAFLAMCGHYGLASRAINPDSPHENGDCESIHGHLRRRINQHLLLRGHRDFRDGAELDAFLAGVFGAANARPAVAARLAEEMAAMRALPPAMLPDYQELECTVSRESTIRVKNAVYSVPARLVGARVRVRVGERTVSVHHGGARLFETERLRAAGAARIEWRHMIGHLARKPGAFARWRHREAMFPSPVFRACYDALEARRGPGAADREYLRVLKFAAERGAEPVETVLEELLGAPPWRYPANGFGLAEVQEHLGWHREMAEAARQGQRPLEPDLGEYDGLLAAATAEADDAF